MILDILREALAIVKQKRATKRDAAEKAAIAKAFNNRYTYRKEYIPDLERLPGTGLYGFTPKGGFAWMCPDCNNIHHPTECSVFSGLQYPECCSHPQGNRLYDNIKTIC